MYLVKPLRRRYCTFSLAPFRIALSPLCIARPAEMEYVCYCHPSGQHSFLSGPNHHHHHRASKICRWLQRATLLDSSVISVTCEKGIAAMEIVKNEMLKSLILLDTKRTFFFLLRPQLTPSVHYLMMAPFDPTLWWQIGECVEFRYRIAENSWSS